MTRLAFLHILKNGGTTLVDRYRHNPGFLYQRTPFEYVSQYRSSQQQYHPIDELTDFDVIFGHGVGMNHGDDTEYVTVLREPINRILSAYNYYRLECINTNNIYTDIDFSTWFINRDRLYPTPTFWQYQHFSTECPVGKEYGKEVDHVLSSELLEQSLLALQGVHHVLSMEDNYIEYCDRLFQRTGMTPDESVQHTHNTRHDLASHGVEYHDYLSDSDMNLVEDHIHYERLFYNKALTKSQRSSIILK